MEKREVIWTTITTAIYTNLVMMVLAGLLFLVAAAVSDTVDVPGVQWEPPGD
ncbi:MAG: hypothetical protein ACRDY7_12620 [Acidimicrobiia bacterium]